MRRPARRARDGGTDPWAKAPVGELSEQLLPRWFVVLGLALVPVAIIVAAVAFLSLSPDEIPLAERRPPPADDLTHDVGQYRLGEAGPVAYDATCSELDGVRVAGTELDQARLRQGLAAICVAARPPEASAALAAFTAADGVVRFAVFEATGVDAAVLDAGGPPQLLLNARFLQVELPRVIAPLIVAQAVTWAGDPAEAETALAARAAELATCQAVLTPDERTRACDDAEELVNLDDPLAALRAAGYR